MLYHPNFIPGSESRDWSLDDPCVWVVYPHGCAGDLLASLINFHYGNTSCDYHGMQSRGNVFFRPTDSKITNLVYRGSNQDWKNLAMDVNLEIWRRHRDYGQMDQVIFSNHMYTNPEVHHILSQCAQAKIIRLLPADNYEEGIMEWLAHYKIHGTLREVDGYRTFRYDYDAINDDRLLEVTLGQLLHPEKFETVYDRLISHLDLPYKLIRHDFIKFWIDHQHTAIQPALKKLTGEYQ